MMHKFSHPGVFTVSAECSTSDWRVTAEKTITIQEPVRDVNVIRCYSTNLSTDGNKCNVLYDRPVYIQVAVDQGKSVEHQITLPQKLTVKNCIMIYFFPLIKQEQMFPMQFFVMTSCLQTHPRKEGPHPTTSQ